MKLYCMSQHIGVRDVQYQLEKLGHELTVYSTSGHSHLMGWARQPRLYDETRILDDAYVKDWWKNHKQIFPNMDGFVSFYPPADVLMYRYSERPLYAMCPIRFLYPYEAQTTKLLQYYRQYNVKLIANSAYDAWYINQYGMECEKITSLCDYTNEHYNPVKNEWIVETRYFNVPSMKNFLSRSEVSGSTWHDLYQYQGHITMDPYSPSVMSFYERYASCAPMFYPDLDYLKYMKRRGCCLREIDFVCKKHHEIYHEPDISKCDWYQYPGIVLYENFGDMCKKSETVDVHDISNKMGIYMAELRDKTLKQWRDMLG